jgi:simple sugar transport system ATP-binding protein
VLRAGAKVADMPAAGADAERLAELMVGRAVQRPQREAATPGVSLLELDGVSAPDPAGRQGLEAASLAVRAGEIVGIAGVSGNGQAALAALVSGLVRPSTGTVRIGGETVARFSPQALVEGGVGRIPEDRHRDGVVGSMRLWENMAIEDIRRPAWQRLGFIRLAALKERARRAIAGYDVRCPGPEAQARLLSGGNIQKLILARVLERNPRVILANQPTRGLDVGAVAAIHGRLLEARARGAAILLISEDLDELFALADRIAVLYRGSLTEALPAETWTTRELGLAMAGRGEGSFSRREKVSPKATDEGVPRPHVAADVSTVVPPHPPASRAPSSTQLGCSRVAHPDEPKSGTPDFGGRRGA